MIFWCSVADLHLREKDKWGKINPDTGLNTRLEDKLGNLRKAINYALEKEVDYFIILGDIFHSLDPGEKLRSIFFECMQGLNESDKVIELVILIGDHDTNGETFNFLSEKIHCRYATIVANEIWDLPWCDFVPFGCEGQIAKIKDKKNRVLFSHMTLDGVEVGPDNYKLQSKYSMSIVKDYLWFELGDIHKPQEFENGCYVGSIAKGDFGERNEIKGFRHGIFKDGKVESKFISVDDRPFIQIDVDKRNYEKIFSFVSKDVKDAVVKVIVTGEKEWINSVSWQQYKDLLNATCSIVRFEYVRTDKTRIAVSAGDSFTTTIEKSVKAYAKKKKMTKKEYEFGLKLLGGCTGE